MYRGDSAYARHGRRFQLRCGHPSSRLCHGLFRRGARTALRRQVGLQRTVLEARLAGPRGRVHRLRHLDDALHRDDRLPGQGEPDPLRRRTDRAQPGRGRHRRRHRGLRRGLSRRQQVHPVRGGVRDGARGRRHALPGHGRHPAERLHPVRHRRRRPLRRHRHRRRDRRALGGRVDPGLPHQPGGQPGDGGRRVRHALHGDGRGGGAPARHHRRHAHRRIAHVDPAAHAHRAGHLPAARGRGRDVRPDARAGRGRLGPVGGPRAVGTPAPSGPGAPTAPTYRSSTPTTTPPAPPAPSSNRWSRRAQPEPEPEPQGTGAASSRGEFVGCGPVGAGRAVPRAPEEPGACARALKPQAPSLPRPGCGTDRLGSGRKQGRCPGFSGARGTAREAPPGRSRRRTPSRRTPSREAPAADGAPGAPPRPCPPAAARRTPPCPAVR